MRALDAAAALIAENGLAAATFDAIADRVGCSIPSLYVNFGTRDGLLRTIFERHSPLVDIEDVLAGDTEDFRAAVRRLYGFMAAVFGRDPQVGPAMFADALVRPNSPVARSLATYTVPRVAVHMMLRPMENKLGGVEFPELDTSCDIFTNIFVCGVSTAPS